MPKRNTSTFVDAGIYSNNGVPSPPSQARTGYRNETLLQGAGRYGYPNFPPERNVGGLFSMLSSFGSSGGVGVGTIHGAGAYSNHHYTGTVYAEAVTLSPPFSASNASSRAAEMYNKMKPTKPVFPAANAFYEMREVPGMLRQRLAQNGLKNIGSYYLALKFGWQPLLRDIISMMNFQQKAQKKLSWLFRHNGKPVRTRYDVATAPISPGMTSGTLGKTQPLFVDNFYIKRDWHRITTTFDKMWASARFRFWLPDGPEELNMNPTMKRRLFGLYPSPQFVWNALPWTWLSDWFVNTGDILANMDVGVADRLAADYFYVMRYQGTNIVHTNDVSFRGLDGSEIFASLTSTAESSSKSRLAGDPFGYSTNQNSLDSGQLAILGALGLSKL